MATKKSDWQRFKAAAERIITALGLGDWHIEICQVWLVGEDDVRARVFMHWTQRSARIAWNENWKAKNDDANSQSPEEYAVHEVLHIVLNPLMNMVAECRSTTADEVDAEEHALIRRLMRVMAVA